MGGVVVDRKWDVERGDRLRAARLQRRLRQKDAAAIFGVSPTTVGRWEAGQPMRVDQLPRIARAYHVSRNWVLHGPPVDVRRLDARVAKLEEVLRVVVARQIELERRLGIRVDPPQSNASVRAV